MKDSNEEMNNIEEKEIEKLILLARSAQERAYAPYSNFRVGACLKTCSGNYYLGCNIENAGYTPTVCAERTAMFKAIFDGERDFEAIAIISDSDNFTSPCGVCRQVLAEFCKSDMPAILANNKGEYRLTSVGELLPFAFTKEDME